MEAFETGALAEGMPGDRVAYQEFIRVPALSMGIYRIPGGTEDPQSPHDEDEVYVVVSGHAELTVQGERRTVGPGAIVFVGARVEHRFEEVTDDLVALVVFAPAET